MRALDAKRDSWKLITSGVLAHDTHGEVVVEEATKADATRDPVRDHRPQRNRVHDWHCAQESRSIDPTNV